MTKIYLVHGWAYDVAKWQPFMQDLHAEGFELKLLHVPGLTTEPLKKAWAIDDYVSWLDEEIDSTPAILLGHSNGGRIILNYALAHPEKVAQLILIDSAGVPPSGLKSGIKRGIFKFIAKTGKAVTKSPKARQLLYKLAREQDYYKADPVMRETMGNLLASDRNLALDKVTAPTALIWGRDDTATPLKQGRVMHRLIKGSTLTVIEGGRHSPHFTHSGDVVAAIVKVLKP